MTSLTTAEVEEEETHLQLKMCLVQEIHVEDIRVLVDGPQEDLYLHQVHDHPVGREHVSHKVFKHVERLHEEVLKAAAEEHQEHEHCCIKGTVHLKIRLQTSVLDLFSFFFAI